LSKDEKPSRLDRRGQAMVEYMLLLAIVFSVAIPLSKQLLGMLDKSVAALGASLEKRLYTGKADIGTWKN